ncbi:MAG TPA: hypothetical protein VE912_13580 [Bacteroidales bacterium]|nr:hypothetical protein [Bacteroidales bacterium]
MSVKISTLLLFSALFIFSIPVVHAQNDEEKPSLDNGTIESQFQYVLDKSSRYEDYKVIKQAWMNRLKAHVADSLGKLHNELQLSHQMVSVRDEKIDSLNAALEKTHADLGNAVKERNSLSFLGLKIDKTAYNGIMWTLVGILAGGLIFFVLMFKRSNYVTVRTSKDLQETKDEFEDFRKRALRREEEIVRKYHNELNKYKSNSPR